MRNIKAVILGVELEAPLLNPEVSKKYEDGYTRAITRIRNAKDITPGSEALKEQCNAVIDYVDETFGEGSSEKVFGSQTDLLTCLEVLEAMTDLYSVQVIPVIREYTDRMNEKMDVSVNA